MNYLNILDWFCFKPGSPFITHFLTEILKGERNMKINYFEDTDTALIHFTEKKVVETREVSENEYLAWTSREI